MTEREDIFRRPRTEPYQAPFYRDPRSRIMEYQHGNAVIIDARDLAKLRVLLMEAQIYIRARPNLDIAGADLVSRIRQHLADTTGGHGG